MSIVFLPDEAEAGALGQLALEHRRGVHARPRRHRRGRRASSIRAASSRSSSRHDHVVVLAARVAGHLAARPGQPLGRHRRRVRGPARPPTTERAPRQELARIGARQAVLGVGQVGHLAVVPGRQPAS